MTRLSREPQSDFAEGNTIGPVLRLDSWQGLLILPRCATCVGMVRV
jgi:hypothetical protein